MGNKVDEHHTMVQKTSKNKNPLFVIAHHNQGKKNAIKNWKYLQHKKSHAMKHKSHATFDPRRLEPLLHVLFEV